MQCINFDIAFKIQKNMVYIHQKMVPSYCLHKQKIDMRKKTRPEPEPAFIAEI